MPKTHRRTWQKRESKAAGLFGSRRNVLSGGSGRDDRTRSASTHANLFIETKTRAACAVRALFDRTKALARPEGKTPVLMLACKGRPGFRVVAHSDDMPAVAAAFLDASASALATAAPDPDPRPDDGGAAR